MFGSPLGQYIHPKEWVRPPGNYEPEVTATFQDHLDGHRNPGVDIGTGRCGDTLYAMCTGIVSLAGLVGYPTPNALTHRIRDGKGYEPAVTHMASMGINPRTGRLWAKGDAINRGEKVGTLGMSGATACHCHMGMKKLINGVWVEIDGWPLLDQNDGGGDMIPIPGANYRRLVNKKTTLIFNGNFRSERKSGVVLKQFPAGTIFFPVAYANDGDVPAGSQSGEWFYGILYDDSPAGYIGGWFHSSLVGQLTDELTTGFTQVDLDNAKLLGRAAGIQAAKDDLADLK